MPCQLTPKAASTELAHRRLSKRLHRVPRLIIHRLFLGFSFASPAHFKAEATIACIKFLILWKIVRRYLFFLGSANKI